MIPMTRCAESETRRTIITVGYGSLGDSCSFENALPEKLRGETEPFHGLLLPLRVRRRAQLHCAEGFRASICLRNSLARFSRFSACFSRWVSDLDGSATGTAGDLAPAPLSSLIALSRTWREGSAPKPTKPVDPPPSLLNRASSAGRAFFTLSDPASLQARNRTERSGSSIIGMIRS